MPPFDVILFDVGGVLLTNGWDHGERAAAVAKFGLDAQEFEMRNAKVEAAWERGEIDVNQYLDAAVFYEPRSFSRDEFFDFILAQSKLLQDGAMEILEEISASNQYLIGALNNEARETNDFRFGKFGLRRYLKVAFSSCYVGLRKPDPAIYRRALDILGSASCEDTVYRRPAGECGRRSGGGNEGDPVYRSGGVAGGVGEAGCSFSTQAGQPVSESADEVGLGNPFARWVSNLTGDNHPCVN